MLRLPCGGGHDDTPNHGALRMTLSITRTFPITPHVTSLIDGHSVALKPKGYDLEIVNPTS
ncbi:MAG: hypothetical protein RL597_1348 [Pseudomonadota bacterium]